MKKLLMLLLLSGLATGAQAQTWAEWFEQKKTQHRYDLEQLAALQLYTNCVQQGYDLAREGLGAIGKGKAGERELHAAYFRALGQVRPAIRGYGTVAATLALGQKTASGCGRLRRQLEKTGQLSPEEVAYAGRVLDLLLQAGEDVRAEVLALTSPAGLQLTDGARLQRLEALYAEAVAQNSVARRLAREVSALVAARWQARHAQEMGNLLQDLHVEEP